MGKREKNNEAIKDQARKMGQYFDNGVFEGTSTMELVDAFKLTDKVKTDYQIMIQNHMTNKKYDAIILAVAHKQFQDFNFDSFKKDKAVIYDVKGILPRNIIDGRL